MSSSKLTLFIFLALIAGIVFGWLAPDIAVKMQPLADMFLRMVKMIIAPLIFATLVVGIAGHGDVKHLGKIGFKTILYFEIVTTVALILGLVMANIFKPGVGFNIDLSTVSMAAVEKMQNVQIDHSLSHMIVDMVPTSVFKSMAEGNLLQIVVFSIFFALAICAIGQKARPVLDFLQGTGHVPGSGEKRGCLRQGTHGDLPEGPGTGLPGRGGRPGTPGIYGSLSPAVQRLLRQV